MSGGADRAGAVRPPPGEGKAEGGSRCCVPLPSVCSRERGVRPFSEALLLTCECLELAAGRQGVGPQDRRAAPCAFSVS